MASQQFYTRAQYEAQQKRARFAWAKYYNEMNRQLEQANIILTMVANQGIPRNNGRLERPAELPTHLTNEFMEMAIQLNKEYTCPCCFDLVNKETAFITFCGHIMCKECHSKLLAPKKCPHCRKSLGSNY